MSISIKLLSLEDDLAGAAKVLVELRPHFELGALETQIRKQMNHGYEVLVGQVDGEVRAVAGFRQGENLAWGGFLYVDDLVTLPSKRSTGLGAALITELKRLVCERNLQQLHLDSGVQRFGAHRFYLRHGFDITSHHFTFIAP